MNIYSFVARNFASTLSVRFLGVLLAFFVERNLAIWLGVNEYGHYTFYRTLFLTLGVLCLLGTHINTIKHSAILSQKSGFAEIARLLNWSKTVAIVSTGVISLCFAIYFLVVKEQPTTNDLWICLIGIVLTLVTGLATLRQSILRGIDKPALANIPKQIVLPLAILVITAVIHLTIGLTFLTALVSLLVATGVTLASSVFLYNRNFPGAQAVAQTGKPDRAWYVESASMAFFDIMLNFTFRVEIFMLGIVGTIAMVAEFNVALRYVLFVFLPENIVNMVVGPTLARLHSAGDTKGLQNVVIKTTAIQLGTTIPLAIPFFIWPTFFLGIFGANYAATTYHLVLLVAGVLANAVFGPCRMLMVMCGLQTELAFTIAAGLVLDVMLNAMLIPSHGVVGAAYSAVVFFMVTNIVLSMIIYKRLGIHTFFPLALYIKVTHR